MKTHNVFLLISFSLFVFVCHSFALGQIQYIENVSSRGSFSIVQENTAANLCVDTNDFAGVIRAAGDLQADVARVTSLSPVIVNGKKNLGKNVVIVGTIGKSWAIDQLIKKKK